MHHNNKRSKNEKNRLQNAQKKFIMKKALYIIAIAFIPWTLLMAQTTSTSSISYSIISGKVYTTNHAPLNKTNIVLTKNGDNVIASTATVDKDGNFLLTGVPKGNYRLNISNIGYIPVSTSITVDTKTRALPIILDKIMLANYKDLPQ